MAERLKTRFRRSIIVVIHVSSISFEVLGYVENLTYYKNFSKIYVGNHYILFIILCNVKIIYLCLCVFDVFDVFERV